MKKNDDLQTPEWVIKQLGNVDLDPCAGEKTLIGRRNYSLERGESGLELPWFGFVFCNPPFSQKELWIKKMDEHHNGFLLLPERGSAPWFAPIAMSCRMYHVMGKKINFDGGSSSNNIGSVIFGFGADAHLRLERINLPGHLVRVIRRVPR